MQETKFIQNWFRVGLYSIVLVALYGTLMRYKIAFDFPFFNQKNLLHAHSHFAFNGWVSLILYSGLAYLVYPFVSDKRRRLYNYIIGGSFIFALGMLVAFTIQGYGAASITFSTLGILVAIVFTILFVPDANRFLKGNKAKPWAQYSLFLNILSALGPIGIALVVTGKISNSDFYLGSVYYYLHFQYNGWFFFAGIAMLAKHISLNNATLNKYFKAFAWTAIPTFFLSILWAKIPMWLYIIAVLATFIQFIAWILFISKWWKSAKDEGVLKAVPLWLKFLFFGPIFCVTLKFGLQCLSIIPSLSHLVFGFRPIVIGYLHLVLLGVFSLFIIGYGFYNGYFRGKTNTTIYSFGFFLGAVLNELLLGIQGAASFTYTPIPFINEMLFGAAVILFLSALLLAISQTRKSNTALQDS